MNGAASRIDWLAKLQNFLQVLAFCLAIAAIQYAFQPDRPYGPPAVHSLFIGSLIWAIVDIGRHLFPSSAETGWPQGAAGVGIVVVGIAVGYTVGNFLGNQICLDFGLYSGAPDQQGSGPAQLHPHHGDVGHRRQLLFL